MIVEHTSDIQLDIDTSYLIILGEIWGGFCEFNMHIVSILEKFHI